MSTVKWSIALLVVGLLGAAAGYQWAARGARGTGATPTAEPSTAPVVADQARRVLYWHDPMRPEVRFDQPGKSPFMDMELVPVYAGGSAEPGGIAISGNAQQSLGIRIGHVEKAVLASRATVVGSVTYDEQDIAVVQARVSGYVVRLRTRALLDRVRRGQILAEVTAPQWAEAEGEYVALLRAESSANASLCEAARQRLIVLGVPESAILDLERTRVVPEATALVAPMDGVITELGLRDGATFEAGAVLFRIGGTARVWVDARVPEALARLVTPGALVDTRAMALPGAVFTARVQSILPQIDPVTRTVGVRIVIDNPAGRLSPGMFVQTTIEGAAGTPQLWIPSEAVIATGERSVVVAKRPDGSFEVADVSLGAEAGGKTAVLSGLTEGQSIVLSGQFLIDSEASLKATINRLSGNSNLELGATP